MIVSVSFSPVSICVFSFQSRSRFFLSQLTRVTQQLCSYVESKEEDVDALFEEIDASLQASRRVCEYVIVLMIDDDLMLLVKVLEEEKDDGAGRREKELI